MEKKNPHKTQQLLEVVENETPTCAGQVKVYQGEGRWHQAGWAGVRVCVCVCVWLHCGTGTDTSSILVEFKILLAH